MRKEMNENKILPILSVIYYTAMTGSILSFFLSCYIASLVNISNAERLEILQITIAALIPVFFFIGVVCWFKGAMLNRT